MLYWYQPSSKHLKKPENMVVSECHYLWFVFVWGTPGEMDLSRSYLLENGTMFTSLFHSLKHHTQIPHLSEHFIRIWEKHVGIKLKTKHGEGGGVSPILSHYLPEEK
jgi:hypothetical protein